MMPDDRPPQLSAFLAAFKVDVEAGTVRSVTEYLAKYSGADVGSATEILRVVGVTEPLHGSSVTSPLGSVKASPSSERDQAPSSERVGPYRILRELGRGGQGAVYLAQDTRIDRRVAIKVLLQQALASQDAIDRFRREAEVASRIDDPGICSTYDFGSDESRQWLAMRYVEGETLASKIRSAKDAAKSSSTSAEPAPPSSVGSATRAEVDRTTALIERVARTLHVAHERGVMHRDIKPANIMVTRTGDPVVLDFGLAGILDADRIQLTQTGDFFGTPAYMSPEQLPGSSVRLDARTDVFSLGVTLYEALTLNRPFEHPTREGLAYAIAKLDPPSAREKHPAISRDLIVVLATALEKDRNRRYQTALDFAEDLRRVRTFEPILARPAGVTLRLRRWSQRNPVLATALAGVFFALGLSVVLLLQKQVALDDYDQLGNVSRLQALVDEADLLWPAAPEKVDAMKRWLVAGESLASRMDGLGAAIGRLRSSAKVSSPAPFRRAPPDTQLASLAEPRSLDAFVFDDPRLQFKHDTLTKLMADLTSFVDADPKKGLLASVRTRLTFAESVRRNTIEIHEVDWKAAIESIADEQACPKYRGLKLRPQIGLIPVGRDPLSGLWEFAHLETAAPGLDPIPARAANGRLVITAETGLIFVLVPGGTFRMGAVRPDLDHDEGDPNVDPGAVDVEAPVHAVTLAPFFLSKYEMTQGQWTRFVGRNPSELQSLKVAVVEIGLRNPVERVSWDDCDVWLGRLGLVMPTEAQWEFSARAGTATPWWSGSKRETMNGTANIADSCAKNAAPQWGSFEDWDDGQIVHAAVGSFDPNGFGLHDVLGNVWEWCRDEFGNYSDPVAAGDGLRLSGADAYRVDRGGSFNDDSSIARSASRSSSARERRSNNLGVRPARRIDL